MKLLVVETQVWIFWNPWTSSKILKNKYIVSQCIPTEKMFLYITFFVKNPVCLSIGLAEVIVDSGKKATSHQYIRRRINAIN